MATNQRIRTKGRGKPGGWRARSPYAQLKSYAVWTLVAFVALAPFVLILAFAGSEWWPVDLVFFPLLLCQTAAAAVMGINMIDVGVENTPVQRWPIIALAVLTIAVAALVPFVSGPPLEPGLTGWPFVMMVVLGLPVVALSPAVTIKGSALASLIASVIVGATWQAGANQAGDQDPLGWFWSALGAFFLLFMLAGSFRLTIWQLMRVREQEEASAVRADLAVAEERLRFSRDLHDIFGRTLTAVVLKSDLAAELAEAGQSEAAGRQMREVQELSDEALREVRAVVAGYRQVDLPTELAGARAVLESAGVRARLVGDPGSVPTAHAEPLAWAVREGVTNVLRHANAATCTIDVDASGGSTVLTITNDGVHTAPVPSTPADSQQPVTPGEPTRGTGLAGVGERLRQLGGTVAHRNVNGTFTLRIEIPGEVR